ncbi:hypothetical protein WR25_16022 [Diploscapter pachys]|uniref:Uncharacterized protein n=1 Tax=Diploscapter pachys TaxID=2018661 RepID=A0A2A2KN70_9BILA|nr:hypothetical protein WR25_16022 [Diploscapter pachys]
MMFAPPQSSQQQQQQQQSESSNSSAASTHPHPLQHQLTASSPFEQLLRVGVRFGGHSLPTTSAKYPSTSQPRIPQQSPRPLSPLEIVSSVESDNDKQEDPLSEAGSPRSEPDEDQHPLNLNITVDSVDDAISGSDSMNMTSSPSEGPYSSGNFLSEPCTSNEQSTTSSPSMQQMIQSQHSIQILPHHLPLNPPQNPPQAPGKS